MSLAFLAGAAQFRTDLTPRWAFLSCTKSRIGRREAEIGRADERPDYIVTRNGLTVAVEATTAPPRRKQCQITVPKTVPDFSGARWRLLALASACWRSYRATTPLLALVGACWRWASLLRGPDKREVGRSPPLP